MQVLPFTRKILVTIGLCEFTDSVWFIRTQFHQRICFATILIVIVAMEVCSLLYVWNHLRIGDIEGSLYAAFQVAAAFCIIGSLLTISQKRREVRLIFERFQTIVDECKL